ncbi:MAG: hypothetical protein F6K61_19270 [Sphaerospermopsis sp. SIO1G1]|nr:hypothetical protein [Sphaerospermopsis sp. SIO1G1]
MANFVYTITRLFNPGRTYLLLAILIFAAANSITRKLTEIGAQNLIDGRNPISFCNVLFVGNLCALLALIIIYGRQWNFTTVKQLSATDWLGLLGVAILSAYLILGVVPTTAQYIGGSVIIIGILINQIGIQNKTPKSINSPTIPIENDMEVGFKGM